MKTFTRGLLIFSFLLAALLLAPTTSEAAACGSNGTGGGAWSALATWDCGAVPASADDVTIKAGDTVVLDVDGGAGSLVIEGTLQFDGVGVPHTLTVPGNVTIGAAGVLNAFNTDTVAAAHILVLGGDFTINGVLDLAPGKAEGATGESINVINVTFNKSGDQLVNGAPTATPRFNYVTLDKGAVANKVLASIALTLRGNTNSITWTNGTWDQTAGRLNLTSGNQSVTANGALIISGTGRLNIDRDLTVTGALTVNSTGTSPVVLIGNGNDLLEVGAGGAATFTAGDIQILGQLVLSGGTTTMNGATILIDPQAADGQGNPVLLASGKEVFWVKDVAGWTMTGGSLTFVDPNQGPQASGDGDARDFRVQSGSGAKSVTSGTIYFGDGTSTTTGIGGFEVNSQVALYNLVVSAPSAGRTVKLFRNLDVKGNLTVDAGGAFDLATYTLKVDGTVTNNGVLKQTVNFADGNAKQFLNIKGVTSSADKYFGVQLTDTSDGAALGDVAVAIQGNASSCTNDAGSPPYARRCFEITPATNGAATVRLYAHTSELNGIAPASLAVYRFVTPAWTKLEPVTTGTTGDFAWAQGATPGFSDFLLADANGAPTAVTLSGIDAIATLPLALPAAGGSLLLVAGAAASRLRRRTAK